MADENMSGRWRLYNEEKIIEDGVVIALFYTGKEITNILDGRYHETVFSGTIKETSGKRNIVKIDGVKSLKKYCEWTNSEFNDVRGMKMSQASILKPLGIKTVNSDTTNIWQKSYYEHIVRNEKEFDIINEYIIYNPLKWKLDEYYNM